MIGDNTLVKPIISEVDIKEMKHGGVDELSILITGVVFHFCIVENLPVLPPRRGHRRVAATGCNAAQSHVVAPQSHRGLWVGCDPRLGEIIYSGERGKWENFSILTIFQ